MTTKSLRELFHQEHGIYAENHTTMYVKWLEDQLSKELEEKHSINNLFNE